MSFQLGLQLHSLNSSSIRAAKALDEETLGGLWTEKNYQQEFDRENGIAWGISTTTSQLIAMGFVWVILDEAHLVSIAVDTDWQRLGLGQLLLSKLLLMAIQKNCQRATLEVNASNRGAIALYESLQFKQLGRRKNYYGKDKDAIIFWLNQLQRVESRLFFEQKIESVMEQLKQKSILFTHQ